jgi:hypothetical protein
MYIHCFLLPLCIEVELYVVNFIANVFVNMQMLLYGMNTITVNIQNYKCYFTEWIQLQWISKTTNVTLRNEYNYSEYPKLQIR